MNQREYFDDTTNPLDHVEEVLSLNNWVYNRANDKELNVVVTGKSCDYDLYFIWQEDMNALRFECHYQAAPINPRNIALASLALMEINTRLWMGHFEILRAQNIPCFRYTALMRGAMDHTSTDSIQDLVNISLIQCERYRHVFTLLSQDEQLNIQTISLAMMETDGES